MIGKTRQICRGDLDHQNPDRVVGVLRLLHGKTDQIITRDVDVIRRGRIQLSRQVAREDSPMARLVAQLDADFGAIAVDEFCGVLPANEGSRCDRPSAASLPAMSHTRLQESECCAPRCLAPQVMI